MNKTRRRKQRARRRNREADRDETAIVYEHISMAYSITRIDKPTSWSMIFPGYPQLNAPDNRPLTREELSFEGGPDDE